MSNMKNTQLTTEQLEILKKCDGVHKTVKEIIECESCALLLDVLE